MQIDSTEMQQVAAAAGAAPRFDMYAGIHKAVRAFLADTLLATGRMDWQDDLELAQVTDRVFALTAFLHSHLEHENDFLHVALEARSPGASQRIAGEHVDHEAALARLRQLAGAVRDAAPPLRPALTQQLYRELALFMADNLAHMHVEETAHNAALWAHYTDAELVGIHDALVGSIPPEEMMVVARWMLPFMNPAERVGVLSNIRENAPPPAFQAILDTVQPHLTQREWEKLAGGLGLAPQAAW